MRYVIGDIHGCLRTYRALVEENIGLRRQDQLYLLGDYIDRGPDPKGVLDYILHLQQEGYSVFPLTGNHEDMFLDAFHGPEEFRLWWYNDAESSLQSFGVEEDELLSEGHQVVYRIPQLYREFISQMELYFDLGDYILVHAGIDFSVSHPFQDRRTMLWSRNPYIDREKLGGKRIIHGHTPVPVQEIVHMVEDTRMPTINLDGGCVYKEIAGLGNLVAMDLETKRIIVRKNMD